MPLAIISFAVEVTFMLSVYALGSIISPGFAIFVIVLIALCTLTSIGCIVYNAHRIKEGFYSKGICVTGLVFSIVGAALGSVFTITALATIASLL